jgi:hypothetical protein
MILIIAVNDIFKNPLLNRFSILFYVNYFHHYRGGSVKTKILLPFLGILLFASHVYSQDVLIDINGNLEIGTTNQKPSA